MEALGCYIVKEEPKKVRKFDDLAPYLISNALLILEKNEDLGQNALDTIIDIAENEAKFFKKHFDQLI